MPAYKPRSMAKKRMQDIPDKGIPYGEDTLLEGSFGAITIFDADFADSDDDFVIAGKDVNLSLLNGKVPNGFTYRAHFNKITIRPGSRMVLIVYGF